MVHEIMYRVFPVSFDVLVSLERAVFRYLPQQVHNLPFLHAATQNSSSSVLLLQLQKTPNQNYIWERPMCVKPEYHVPCGYLKVQINHNTSANFPNEGISGIHYLNITN